MFKRSLVTFVISFFLLCCGGLSLADYDLYQEWHAWEKWAKLCIMPPVEPSVTERIHNRHYPSVFKVFTPYPYAETAEEWITARATSEWHVELLLNRMAKYDLVTPHFLTLKWATDKQPYYGLATQVGGDLQRALEWEEKLRGDNPNLVALVQISFQSRPTPFEFPPDTNIFLRHPDGQFVDTSGEYHFNILLPEVQQLLIDKIVGIAECRLFDGVILDGFVRYGTGHWSQIYKELSTFAGRPITDEDIIEIHRDIFRKVRERVHPDFLIVVNAGLDQLDRYAEFINGAFMETGRWYIRWHTPTKERDRRHLMDMETSLSWNEENLRSPQVNCLESRPEPEQGPSHTPENQRWMRLVTTLTLTHSNGYVNYTTHLPDELGHHRLAPWYAFWDADLGRPVGGDETKGQTHNDIEGLFIREFTNGWAVYNRSGVAQTISLPEETTGVASKSTGLAHTLPDLDGEIYLKQMRVRVDLNGDGVVNILDLVIVANNLGGADPDLNGDGVVNILDLVIVANAF